MSSDNNTKSSTRIRNINTNIRVRLEHSKYISNQNMVFTFMETSIKFESENYYTKNLDNERNNNNG